MALPDFLFYTDEFFGISIPESDFPRLAVRADEEIQAFERKFTVTGEEVQRHKAVCAIADALYTFETVASMMIPLGENGAVGASSVSIGSVSTSFKAPDVNSLGLDLTDAGQQRTFYNLLKKYMVVYRGLK